MNYVCTLLAVTDLEKSKKFYGDVLGLTVTGDFGANVTLSGGISLQTAGTWKDFIHKNSEDIVFGGNECELYFEEDDIDLFIEKLKAVPGIQYVHPLTEHSWGQRVVRFYDPDKHIIEVGESIGFVVKRFIKIGLSVEETAARMDVPADYVRTRLS
ncbi:hypothetical protein SDC9_85150 [bioreactor metagenome]|uniref:VOC domain-containing protein n=1 Tax=bioreactor metagenome TaxID=1076179 RepID=A0A644ZF53_9ZZZZ